MSIERGISGQINTNPNLYKFRIEALSSSSGGDLMKRALPTPVRVAAFLLLVFGFFAFVPLSSASDFFLHSSTSEFLDNTSPTATTAKFKDSVAVNRTTYQEIGTWAAAPAVSAIRLNSLGDLRVWIGLKNSDDQGTYFDLRAELRKNGVVIAFGETKNIQGVTRNPSNAKEVTVSFGAIADSQFNPGDVLSVKILTKVADSGGHNNAVGLRLYYDAVSRPSRFGAVFVVDNTLPTIAATVNPARLAQKQCHCQLHLRGRRQRDRVLFCTGHGND
jgi:hypothetical protein